MGLGYFLANRFPVEPLRPLITAAAAISINDAAVGSGTGVATFLSATFAMGGDEKNLDPGFKYFAQLFKAGNLKAVGRNVNVESNAPSACCALYCWQKNQISLARFSPTVRAR